LVAIAAVLFGGPVAFVAAAQAQSQMATPEGELHLEEVLEAVEKHFPVLAAASLEIEQARGKQMQARGAFDLRLRADLERAAAGKFDAAHAGVGLAQATPFWGLGLKAGYRNGYDFPVYHGGRVTGESGELGLEARLPLLRDRAIDLARLGLQNTDLDVEQKRQKMRMVRLKVRLEAAKVFLKWVSSGQKLQLARRLLDIATDRQRAIDSQIESGKIPAIDRVDNERLIISRQERVIGAQQVFETTALVLSLYWRTDEGEPIIPAQDALPVWPPPTIDDSNFKTQTETNGSLRPDLRALEAIIAQVQNERRFARNTRLPNLDLKAAVKKDLGDPRPYAPFADSVAATEVGLALSFKLPVQRRKARGKMIQLDAQLAGLETELSFLRDTISVEIAQAAVAVDATRTRAELSQNAAAAAHTMEQAERTRFLEGQSNLLLVNLRELAAADAETRFIDAWAEHELARMSLLAATGTL